MTNSILNNNLKLISKYNRELEQKILNISDLNGNYEIKESKSGDSILFKDSIPFDNGLDPVWDALEKYNKLEDKTNKNITLIYGLGLGYILKEFAKRHKGKIILYEPNPEILRISLELVDFSPEFENKNIRICSDYEEIKKAYLDLFFMDYKLNIVPVNYYENGNLEEIAEFKQQIEKIHSIYQSNYRNLVTKGHKWTTALFKNIPNIIKNQDLHTLKNKYKGKTAVIISAGPSLDKNIKDLIPYRDKVVVFCVGTALKTALENGIIPDFAVAIEISPNTEKHLDFPEISDINVIAATGVYDGVFNLKPKCFLNYHINKEAAAQWYGNLLQVPIDEYESAGTVSIIALYSAKMMGIDNIIFIGQDLAYTDNQCYSKNSIYGHYVLDDQKTVSVSDKEKLKQNLQVDDSMISSHIKLLNKDLYFVKGQNGEKVLSRSDLILFIVYFEEIAEKYGSEIKFVNSTEGGAFIKGFEHIPLKTALEKYIDEVINKESHLIHTQLSSKDLKKRKKIVLSELSGIIKNCYQVKTLLENVVNKNIKPYLSSETIIVIDNLSILFPKIFNKGPVNNILKKPEYAELRDFWSKNINDLNELIERDLNNLLKENPGDFADNLKIIKDNYLIINNLILNNALVKNVNIRNLLIADNLIKDFENTDENLIFLFKHLSFLFIFVNGTSPEYINFMKELIDKIEL